MEEKKKIYIFKYVCLILLIVLVYYFDYQSTNLHEKSHVNWNKKFNCTESIVKISILTSKANTQANCTFTTQQEELTYHLGHQLTDANYEENVYNDYVIIIITALFIFNLN